MADAGTLIRSYLEEESMDPNEPNEKQELYKKKQIFPNEWRNAPVPILGQDDWQSLNPTKLRSFRNSINNTHDAYRLKPYFPDETAVLVKEELRVKNDADPEAPINSVRMNKMVSSLPTKPSNNVGFFHAAEANAQGYTNWTTEPQPQYPPKDPTKPYKDKVSDKVIPRTKVTRSSNRASTGYLRWNPQRNGSTTISKSNQFVKHLS